MRIRFITDEVEKNHLLLLHIHLVRFSIIASEVKEAKIETRELPIVIKHPISMKHVYNQEKIHSQAHLAILDEATMAEFISTQLLLMCTRDNQGKF